MLNDASQHTVKTVIQIFSSVYPLLFRTLYVVSSGRHACLTRCRCINRNPVTQWDTLTRVKKRIVELLEKPTPTTSMGVREAALKFVHRVIQVQTRGVSDPRVSHILQSGRSQWRQCVETYAEMRRA